MNRTLGYAVQRVLEKLDLDSVNSINDSPDAMLIAREAENTYYDLVSRNDWPERYDLIEVDSVSDVSNPTALRLPDNLIEMKWLAYDTTKLTESRDTIDHLEKITPDEFLRRVYNRDSSEENVVTIQYRGTPLYLLNDKDPEFYTSFDNATIILDSWDITQETTVQGNKTIAFASTVPNFKLEDEFVLPLDALTFPLFLAELTAAMSVHLNGQQAIEEERRRNRGIARLRRESFRTQQESLSNKFGRNGDGRS